MSGPVIVTRGLTKHFGGVVAVDGVDLEVREGDRFGFLGPNGSGKTTTVRMLLGLVFATRGSVEVMGAAVPRRTGRALAEVGSLVEGPAAYGHLSGRANLRLLDAAGGRGPARTRRVRVDAALDSVGLGGVGRRPVKAYSLGMRARLGLAAALMRAPRLLILDEPTNGLDPQGIHEVRELLLGLNRAGTTVFLSSHLLGEVEELCSRVAVIDRGRLVLQDELAVLRAPTGRVAVATPDVQMALGVLDGHVEHRAGDRLLVRGLAPEELTARLVAAGARVRELGLERRTLEQVVLQVTSHGSDRVPAGPQHPGPQHAGPQHAGPQPNPQRPKRGRR